MIKSKIFGGKPRIWPIIGLESILKMNTKTYPLKEVLLGCSQDQFKYKISKLYRTVTNGQDAVQLNLETVTVPVVFTEWNHYWILYTIYLQCIQANNSVVWVTDVAHCNLFHIIYYFILIKFMYF